MRLMRIVMVMVSVAAVAWTPSAMAQQAPRRPAEKDQKAVMAQKARAAVLDQKIKDVKAAIEALPKSHREEIAALMREREQISKDHGAIRKQMSANAEAQKRLSGDRVAQEKAYHAGRAELRRQRDAVETRRQAAHRELKEKEARVNKSNRATPVSAQALPALKSDIERLRAEEDRLQAEGRRLKARIDEGDAAQAQRPKKSSQAEALRAEGNRLLAELAKLRQRETDVKARLKSLLDGDKQVAATRSATTEELRRLQAERVALGR